MLLRFAAENIMSFKDAVEFNTFPSSKSHSHDWHKVVCKHATVLRMTAIYGANGAGKSNLLKCVSLLRAMVMVEKLGDIQISDDLHFKLDREGYSRPSELAVEFFTGDRVFYYHVVFNGMKILEEDLSISGKSKDTPIFTRKDNNIEVSTEFFTSGGNEKSADVFLDAISRVIRPDMLALSFFGRYYPDELPIVKTAFDWFPQLQVIAPSMTAEALPYLLEKDAEFASLVNEIVPELNTGISSLRVNSIVINEGDVKDNAPLRAMYNAAKANPGKPQTVDLFTIIMENGVVMLKSLMAVHVNSDGKEIGLNIREESDGTRRLVEYMPLLYSILRKGGVFVIDEIERSIHPIMIKSIMRKISESRDAQGQIIFTTHESCLLDQNIFRPDEIWFAQKDVNQSTQLYPLSVYNIHKTANIENGYLNGRYGGIPFLSNLSDLKW